MQITFSQLHRPILQIGIRHPMVKDLQRRISQYGRPISITGLFDFDTELVVKCFQSHFFLKPDGIVGPLTWKALDSESPVHQPILSQGRCGAQIESLQELLSIDLYYLGMIDGEFGSATLSAVKKFQADHGLVANGQVDQKTWQALTEL